MTTVQKIHNDFFTAGDKIINAAKAIIEKGLLEKGNAIKLMELGFTQCAEVKKHQILKGLVDSGDKASYYAQKYPTAKFITRKQVDKICKKYKLLFGDVGIYTGSIPQKNINEILAFKVNDEDLDEAYNLNFFSPLLLPRYFGMPEEPKKETPVEEKKYVRSLKICAPKTMMNMQGQKIFGNEIVPEDPIVLHPVKDGFLIVTAWGNEASDELVVNEQMN